MMRREAFWWVVLGAALIVALAIVTRSIRGNEQWMAIGFVVTEATLAMLWIVHCRAVESSALAFVNKARRTGSLTPELTAAANDDIERAQTIASNSLIAIGIIASATFLVWNAARFLDPATSSTELLALAPKAFTSTGFGILCGVIVMLRAHFVPLQQLAEAGRFTSPRFFEPAAASQQPELAGILQQVATDFREASAALKSDQGSRGQALDDFRQAAAGIGSLLAEAKAGLSRSAFTRVADATKSLSSDVQHLQTIVTTLIMTLENQAEVIREQSRSEIYQALGSQAQASLDAFRNVLVSGFGERMQQVAGNVEQRIEGVARAAEAAASEWETRAEETMSSVPARVERAATDSFKQVRDQLDLHLRQHVGEVMKDALAADRELGDVLVHLREINETMHLLAAGLSDTSGNLRRLALPAISGDPSVIDTFFRDLQTMAATVTALTQRLVSELQERGNRREHVRSLRDEISRVLDDVEA